MNLPAQHLPTLLVFTLGARCESRRRRLLPATLNSIEDGLHQACLDSTLAAGREAGCRLEVSSPLDLVLPADVLHRKQRGCNFGSRLEQAVTEAFKERGGPVLLVGSDVPDLEASHLSQTLRVLEEDPDRVVIGPSPDGGLYLLAAARPFDTELAEVRWGCRRTLQSLKRALSKGGRTFVMLPPLLDLDRRADLKRWLSTSVRHSGAAIWQILRNRRLLSRLAATVREHRRSWLGEAFSVPSRCTVGAFSLRGPPNPSL